MSGGNPWRWMVVGELLFAGGGAAWQRRKPKMKMALPLPSPFRPDLSPWFRLSNSPVSHNKEEVVKEELRVVSGKVVARKIAGAKQLGGLVANEAKYLYEVSDKIEHLQRDLQWMHCFLEDADNRQHLEKVVALWVGDIRDFAYEAEEIIEKYVHKVSHPRQNGGWINTIRWMLCALGDAQALHEVGSDIADLRSRIAELISRLQLYGIKVTKEEERIANNFKMREQRQTYSHILEDPVGLQEHTKKVVEQLVTNDEVKVVGIWGMGGLGKTILARQVFQDKTTKAHFKNRVWVCISKQFEVREVFKDILKELTNVKDANKESELHANEERELGHLTGAQILQKICEILNQNTCLVVLDDVWSNDDWHALKPAFDSIQGSPSKILITSRNNGLIQDEVYFQYSHQLNLLDDDDSWKLLQRIAFLATEIKAESLPHEEIESDQTKEDPDMKTKEKLRREMLKHCKGLPLAIVTLGGVLCKKKSVAEWKTVQKNIASYLMGHLKQQGTDNKGLFAVLELSYKDLPFYLKPCFMYLGHFPEDHEISAERLYHLWEAEGLVITEGDEVEEMCVDEIAELYLKGLVDRCLVQVAKRWVNGRISKIRLHDVMRDMCLNKCKEVNFLSIIKQSSKIISSFDRVNNRKLRRCALYLGLGGPVDGDDPPFDPSPQIGPCIRSLLVFESRDSRRKVLSPNMSKSLLLLRVLDLESARNIPLHPNKNAYFIHLRYVSFKGLRVFDLDLSKLHIWECKFLETLDLRVHDMFGFEFKLSNKFWKLERLRHLYLPEPRMQLEDSRKLILTDTQLQQMETLRNFSVGVCEITDLRKMTSLRVFSFTPRWGGSLLSREELEQLLESPVIVGKRLVKPLHLPVRADVINEGTSSLLTDMHSLVCISGFDVSGRIEAAANLDIFHKLRHLTKLSLSRTEIGQEGISVLEKLPLLKKLTLWSESIAAGNKMSFSNGAFPQLNRLELARQEDLEEWEIGEGTLPNLQTLHIDQCGKLKMIPDGLPKSVVVTCRDPCISGVENYNICRFSSARKSCG